MKIGRNERCPCGSGKKYKQCCELKQASGKGDWSKKALYVVAAALVLGLVGFIYSATNLPDDGRVWSAEHGHWHNADGTELSAAGTAGARFVPQPPGPVPDGMVWSTEHGHWHDAATGMEPQANPITIQQVDPGTLQPIGATE